MSERHLYRSWRGSNQSTHFPFSDLATLRSRSGLILLEGTFLDAAIFPVGGRSGAYLSVLEVGHDSITVRTGDSQIKKRTSGTFALVSPPDIVELTDGAGRPAGVLVSESDRLASLQSLPVGIHEFSQAATEFAASVCFPVAESGVSGITLEDGTTFGGDVWIVGEDGVVVRTEELELDPKVEGVTEPIQVVRFDIIGDPLFRRRLCTPSDLFVTPRFIKAVRIVHADGEFVCFPDALGGMRITIHNGIVQDTVLRLQGGADALILETVGSESSKTSGL